VLTTARVGLFAWSWRRPLFAIGAALLGLPLLTAGIVVQARQGSVGSLFVPVDRAIMTQPFGCTTLEIEPWSSACVGGHFHSGIDLAAPLDTPVHAATGGVVTIHRERGGYGLYMLVVRDPKLSTLYAHLDWPLVRQGEVVAAGQTIALMGSTGNSTGPHLHFEVRIAGIPVDPLPLLQARGGDR
jgi:murein DD-endopeptidase MepM/ murein hydrolase activator NlpD